MWYGAVDEVYWERAARQQWLAEKESSFLVCTRDRCGGWATHTDGRGYHWCRDHRRLATVIDAAAQRGSPGLTLPDGRMVLSGLAIYVSVARYYGLRDLCLVLGALLAMPSRTRREYC